MSEPTPAMRWTDNGDLARPKSVDKHLSDLERFFGPDPDGHPTEWGWGNGTTFHALRAVRAVRRYVTKLENEVRDLA